MGVSYTNVEEAEKKKKIFLRRDQWSRPQDVCRGFLKLGPLVIQVNQVKGWMKVIFLFVLVCYVSANQVEPCECLFTHGFGFKCHCEKNISNIKLKLKNGDLYSLHL